jgi:apolipoprotein D and lipocalin family protein
MRRVAWIVMVGACGGEPEGTNDGVDDPPPPVAPEFAPYAEDGVTVAQVDIDRYLGTWFELGTFPIFWQASCVATTATYGVRDDGDLSVLNRCLIGDLEGEPFSFLGRARVVDDTNARLEVSFSPTGEGGAPYWVVELDGAAGDAPYEWAVVSGPDNLTLWILAREPKPNLDLDPILARLEERGFDLERFVWTVQPEEPFDPLAE